MKHNLLAIGLALLYIAHFSAAATPSILGTPNTVEVTSSTAIVFWQTDLSSFINFVTYGQSESLGANSTVNATDSTDHFIDLSQLTPSQQYYFTVTSCIGENCTSAGTFSFTTLEGSQDLPAPQIQNESVNANAAHDSAQISWTTDIPSNSFVYYGISAGMGNFGSLDDNVTSHIVSISGLVPSTTYYYLVQSCNSGNCTNSSQKSFSTLPNPTATPTFTPTPTPTTQSGGVLPPPSICVDSDGGKDYFQKGRLISGNENGDDTCETGDILREYVCNDEGTLGGMVRYKCPLGCIDGTCIQAGDPESPSPSPTLTGFLSRNKESILDGGTKISAVFYSGKSIFSISQSLDFEFVGLLKLDLPFSFDDYYSGRVSLTPKPSISGAKPDGSLTASWEMSGLEGGSFTIEISADAAYGESTLQGFVPAILLREDDESFVEADVAALVPAEAPSAKGHKGTPNPATGLAAVGPSEAAEDRGWPIAAAQIILLISGILAINYFERDFRPLNAEQTSSVLEGLEEEALRKRR